MRPPLQRVIVPHAHLADAWGEHKVRDAAPRLLVAAPRAAQARNVWALPQASGQPQPLEQSAQTFLLRLAGHAKFLCDGAGGDHSQTDRFPMRQPGAPVSFERMPEGVAEVQRGADSTLLRVQLDEACFDPTAARHQSSIGHGTSSWPIRGAALQLAEQSAIRDHRVLHDFAQTAPTLALGEGLQPVGAGNHDARMVKSTDGVLRPQQVGAHLATDRCIDHAEERRRGCDPFDAPHVGRGGETGDVGDHTPPQRHDQAATVQTMAQQCPEQGGPVRDALGALASSQHHGRRHAQTRSPQGLRNVAPEVTSNVAVRHHNPVPILARQVFGQHPGATRCDADGVRLMAAGTHTYREGARLQAASSIRKVSSIARSSRMNGCFGRPGAKSNA
jgi:hypothetical protein